MKLSPQELAEATHSLKKYFAAELDQELGDLQARLLLDYVLREFGPLAYNQGVKDAEEFFRTRLEDLSATCFQPPLTHWQQKSR